MIFPQFRPFSARFLSNLSFWSDPHYRCGTISLLHTAPRDPAGAFLFCSAADILLAFFLVGGTGFSLWSFQFGNPKTQV